MSTRGARLAASWRIPLGGYALMRGERMVGAGFWRDLTADVDADLLVLVNASDLARVERKLGATYGNDGTYLVKPDPDLGGPTP